MFVGVITLNKRDCRNLPFFNYGWSDFDPAVVAYRRSGMEEKQSE